MDDRHFDTWVRLLAIGGSRRRLLKVLLGLGGAAAIGGILPESETDAARRPTPTPKPLKCPGKQVPVNGVCTCPDGLTKCGPDCCTAGGQCCDNACCYGTCYGEELCCPSNHLVCNGVCLAAAECCADADCPNGQCIDNRCTCVPRTCADFPGFCRSSQDDGCGGVLDCSGNCPDEQSCLTGWAPDAFCAPNAPVCLTGQTWCPGGSNQARCGASSQPEFGCLCVTDIFGTDQCISGQPNLEGNVCGACTDPQDCADTFGGSAANWVCTPYSDTCGNTCAPGTGACGAAC